MVLRLVSLSFCYVKGRERRSKPISFSLLEKEWFLESKEKGAPVRVEWSQIGIRRPVFTPPSRSSPVYGRLPRRNRDKRWSYPHFFRRLRGWVSGRGAAARYSLYRGARLHLSSLFTLHFSLFLLKPSPFQGKVSGPVPPPPEGRALFLSSCPGLSLVSAAWIWYNKS